MKMQEYVNKISFSLGMPANENIEGVSIPDAVNLAFMEIKEYMKTPVNKTVPYQTRIDLKKVGIVTTKIIYVQPAYPRIGLTLGTIDSGNVFQVAASVNIYNGIGNTSTLNINPIVTEMAMAQVRNTLSTDFQWSYDQFNQVVYCAHKDPRPTVVTIKYVPDLQDVSEIVDNTYINYVYRLALAHTKVALGRSRSKYTVEGSNVSLDGEQILSEGNTELETIRNELDRKQNKLVIIN